MQGFFQVPIDNLRSESLFAHWIKLNIPKYRDQCVVVSKNPGGTKRVTSLADVLRLSFGIVTTERIRNIVNMSASMMWDRATETGSVVNESTTEQNRSSLDGKHDESVHFAQSSTSSQANKRPEHEQDHQLSSPPSASLDRVGFEYPRTNDTQETYHTSHHSRDLSNASGTSVGSIISPTRPSMSRSRTSPLPNRRRDSELTVDEYTDERAEFITGRLVQGHVVDEDYPSPALSATATGSISGFPLANSVSNPDPMTASFMSTASSFIRSSDHPLGGSKIEDAGPSADSDEEEDELVNPIHEHTITLVGDVRYKTVLILDDIMDQAGSWIAAAECVVKRGGAKKVYCMATHALFTHESLHQMQDCDCIDYVS
jgi:ribose-phosphate pyrophosphokinase